jgi:hypothetical protein
MGGRDGGGSGHDRDRARENHRGAATSADALDLMMIMARGPYIAATIIVVLAVALLVLTNAVVRLENYRYANASGSCTQFDITSPQQRVDRDKCLEATQTRTHWFWHVLFGVGLF